ncbi:MAG: hypothetical protein LBH48_03870 [Bifidobacteriaceae bacterium]|nr:hypothetical protein [Bifidobacteriaceae bacterium]
MIRLREVFREAWRDTATGTSRALLALVLFAAGVGAAGWSQAVGVKSVAQDAAAWVEAGAAVRIVEFPGLVDGAQCEALSQTAGVAASGALRAGPELRLAALPSRTLTAFEATPGMGELLNLRTPEPSSGLGVWLSQDLAAAMAARPGSTMAVLSAPGRVAVAGVFPFPDDDGRNPLLAYSVVEPVAAAGVFDACWVELWPERTQTAALATLVANPVIAESGGATMTPEVRYLNASLGVEFDARGRLERLPTRGLLGAACLFALALGFGLIRLRRLELASSLHAGIAKPALAAQMLVEAATWVGPACLALAPLLWWAAARNNPDPPWLALFLAAQTVALASLAVLLGTLAATLAVREKHLFKTMKNR